MQHIGLILFSVFFNSFAQLCLKAGMKGKGDINLTWENTKLLLAYVVKNPFIEIGILCYIISVFCWMWTLAKVDVSVAYPMLSLGYIVSVIAGYFWFNEPITIMRLCGIGVIMVGVYLVAAS